MAIAMAMAGHETLFELRTARSHPVIVLVSAVDRRLLPALRFVSRLPFARPVALHIAVDPDTTRRLADDWMALGLAWLPLHIRDDGDGGIAASVAAIAGDSDEPVTVVVPELDLPRWWHPLLHRRSARHIAAELQDEPGVTAVIVPFRLAGQRS